MSIKF